MVALSVAFDITGSGAVARLRVDRTEAPNDLESLGPTGNLHYDDPSLVDDEAVDSLARAQEYVSRVLGWPPPEVHLVVRFAQLTVPPAVRGPSLFGAFCLALMRAVVDLEVCHGWAATTIAPYVRVAALDRVGISAACDEAGAAFAPVGSIERKLKAFAAMPADHFAVAVTAVGQSIHGRDVALGLQTVHVDGVPVPVLGASDPVDAFKRLCELQARAAVSSM